MSFYDEVLNVGKASDESFDTDETVIKTILKHSVGAPSYGMLVSMCKSETGSKPSLLWFVTKFQSFPIFIGRRKVQYQRDIFGELKNRFTKTPCFEGWVEIDSLKPEYDSRVTGCVFTWPRFGVCCIHRMPTLDDKTPNGFWIKKRLSKEEMPFVIEPFTQLLETISWEFPSL